jgi:hypothetical protein
MTDTVCRTCSAVIRMPRMGQRYCSHACQQAGYRNRQKSPLAVTRKQRLYPYTGCRHENTEIPQSIQREFSPPMYCLVEARAMPPKGKGMMPPGPPPPLSDVEIAALGGHVVTVKRRPYTPKAPPHAYADDATGPTPGALQADYPLEYCEDGYPKLPAWLDRRKPACERQAA